MKKSIAVLFVICVFLRPGSGHSAPFQDLNFDSANTNTIFDVSGLGDYYGPAADLMPGWSAGGVVGFNLAIPGLGYRTLVSPTYVGSYPVIGSYSFAMVPFQSPQSISQSGDLPSDVRSIHFVSYGSPFQLEVNGSLISLGYTPRPGQPGWDRNLPVFDVAGDISPFAGQTVELRFTTVIGPSIPHGLDEIYFSTQPIPEPATLLLLSLGGLAFISRRR